MIKNKKNLLLLLALLLVSIATQAQEEVIKSPFIDTHLNGIVKILAICILSIFLFVLYHILSAIVYFMAKNALGEDAAEKYRSLFPSYEFKWTKVSHVLTDAVDIEHEQDILLDHDYDGIKELDNHLPPWWKYMFYACIVWGVGYFSYNIIWDLGDDQYEKYDKKVAAAEIQKAKYLATMANNVDENSVTLLSGPAQLQNGSKIFTEKCATCHGNLGEGKIGPNLTDEYWLHGGDIKDVFTTVKYGVANKMIAWQDQLLPSEINEVASYVLTLQGSNPPNALEPQGDLYEAPEAVADSITTE